MMLVMQGRAWYWPVPSSLRREPFTALKPTTLAAASASVPTYSFAGIRR